MVRSSAPPLLPILRSQAQGKVLAMLYLHPDNEYSLAELGRLLDLGSKRVHDEVNRLLSGGLVTDRQQGNMRLVQAHTGTSIAGPLTDLVLATFGPLPVLRESLSIVDGIDAAYIYGSWAARYWGHSGGVPHDVDLLIVGSPDRDHVYDVTESARYRIGKDVNVTYMDPATWLACDHAFVRELRDKPLVTIVAGAE